MKEMPKNDFYSTSYYYLNVVLYTPRSPPMLHNGPWAAFLGTKAMPWDLIGIGAGVSLILFIYGAFYFRKMENTVADIA